MTRIVTLFFTLLFCSACLSEPQVWQASKKGWTFTIMGSVHAGKQAFYPLPLVMDTRLKNADALFVEADITQGIHYTLPKGKNTRELLNDEQKKALNAIAQEINLPFSSLLNMPPWQTSIALQMSQINALKLKQALGIDQYYLLKSQKWTIPVIGFETVQEQINLLAHAGENGMSLLSDTLTHWQWSKQMLPCIIEAWAAGDSQTMTQILETQTDDGFEKKLLEDRNHRWIEQMTQAARTPPGNYVVVVGALHLYAKEGILRLFKEKGFDVTLLTQGKKISCPLLTQK